MPHARTHLARLIRDRREILELSQRELADRIGRSRETVARHESGAQVPELALLRRYRSALRLELDDEELRRLRRAARQTLERRKAAA